MVHPWFKFPIKFSFGTLTSSKNVSQKGDLPLINFMGLVLTPFEAMSINIKLIPLCFVASKSVRTKQNIQSDLSA